MKSPSGRSADYASFLRALITSVKLLQEATQSTNLPIPNDPLAGVAVDHLEAIRALKANKDVGEELAEKIVHHVGTIYHELARSTSSESDVFLLASASVTRYTKVLADAQGILVRLSQRGPLGQSLLRARDRKELLNVMSAVNGEFASFMEALGREQNPAREFRRSQHIILAPLQDFGIQRSGRPVSPLSAKEVSMFGQQQPQQRSYCWPGTRIPILDEIDHWATATTSSSSLIYWLADAPGSGKSTIAASLAEVWRSNGILGGYYDFETSNSIYAPEENDGSLVPGIGDIVDALCEALATQLGAAYPELSSLVFRALSDVHCSPPASSLRSLSRQLALAILDPLKTLQRARYGLQPHAKILFILDSIEKCPPHHRAAILQVIKDVNSAQTGTKFLLIGGLPTIGDNGDISDELLDCPPSILTRGSINIHSASNMADILLYLTSQFHVHAPRFNRHSQFRVALIEPTIRALMNRAEGLILWASLAFEILLMADNPTRMLLSLVEEDALADVNGLYLELVLTAQSNLDVLNKLRVPAPKGGKENRLEDISTGASTSPVTPVFPEAFPRNALASVLSALGYAAELLSVAALAEFTGLGLERTVLILDLLSLVIDSSQSSLRGSTSQPYLAQASSSRVNLSTTRSTPSPNLATPKPKKRASSAPRKSSFSPPRRQPRPLSSYGVPIFPVSPTSGNLSPSPDSSKPSDMETRSTRNSSPSGSRNLLAPSAGNLTLPLPSVAQAGRVVGDHSTRANVRIRHTTFREWIRLPHPPTLLSCLTGMGTVEEGDLRFVIAPSLEGAHAMLAKGCLGFIRTTTLTAEQVEERCRDAGAEDGNENEMRHGKDGGDIFEDDVLSYACRYWAYHCAELLKSLTAVQQHSEVYMSSSSSLGSRWKGIRGEMLEFFTRRLLWWVEVSVALRCTARGRRGLKALREVFMNMHPEENLQSTVDQLMQWTSEALRLLEDPLGFLEEERNLENLETSLVYKYFGEELRRQATLATPRTTNLEELQHSELAEREKAQWALAAVVTAAEAEKPPPPLSDWDPAVAHLKSTPPGVNEASEVIEDITKSKSTMNPISANENGRNSKEEVSRSGDSVDVRSPKRGEELPQMMEREQSDSQLTTTDSTTPTTQPILSSEAKDIPASSTAASDVKVLPSPPHGRRAELNNETAIEPSPQKIAPSSDIHRGYYPMAAAKLFPGLAFFQTPSQQSSVSPVSPSTDLAKRNDFPPYPELAKPKDSSAATSLTATVPPTSVRSVPLSPEETKNTQSSNHKTSTTSSTN